MIHRDVFEHLPVHQDVENGVMTLLIDQRAGLERLVEALLDHLHDHSIGLILLQIGSLLEEFATCLWHQPRALGLHPVRVGWPYRGLQVGRKHDVKQLLEVVHILPFRRRVCLRFFAVDRRSVGWRIQRDESAPRIKIEASLQVFQAASFNSSRIPLRSRTHVLLTRQS